MNKLKTLLVLAALVPSLALASGFEVINVNPRDLALSSSGVAAQQDAGATNVNPAALSRLEGFNLSLAGSMLSLTTKWTAPNDGGASGLTGTSTTKFAPTPPVALFAAYGTKVGDRGLGFGVGLGTPGGGQMRWNDDWQGRGRIITVERRMLGFYATAGYEVMPWLRVGGGAVYYYGIQYLKQGIEPFQGAFGELATKGGGFSFELAAEAKLLPNLTFGIDYKHKGTMSMKGDGHFEVPPALAGPATQDQGVSQDLTFPNTLAAGFAWKPARPVQLTLQYSYSRFRVYETDTFIGDAGLVLTVPRDYRDGHIVRGGVEWFASDRLTVRFGAMRDFSGLRTSTLSPTLPDSNTTGVSTGFSWAFRPDLSLGTALFYGDRDKQTASPDTTNGGTAFPGSYKTNVWIVSAGVVWKAGQ
jgi:long-chain fatty acid transport protein